MKKLKRKEPYGMIGTKISKSTWFRAWRTKRMIKNFLFEFYDGNQDKGTELLANMILEIQREAFYEDNDITAISFFIDNFIKASAYEMEYTLKYKEGEDKKIIRRKVA